MLTVGIKYCGGCNPKYDRAQKVQELQKHYPQLCFSYAVPAQTYDFLIVICGCHANCASHENLSVQSKKFILCEEQDFEQLYTFFDNLNVSVEKL